MGLLADGLGIVGLEEWGVGVSFVFEKKVEFPAI